MTHINGIDIPEAGTTVQRIADPIGGHLYTVTTLVTVEVGRLDEVQRQISAIQADIQEKQTLLAELQSKVVLIPVIPDIIPDTASSTPAIL